MICVFDNRGRETFCDYSDTATPDVPYAYDAAGRQLTGSSSVAGYTYAYDAANQLLSETGTYAGLSGNHTVGYAYNADGNRASLTYPDGSNYFLDLDYFENKHPGSPLPGPFSKESLENTPIVVWGVKSG